MLSSRSHDGYADAMIGWLWPSATVARPNQFIITRPTEHFAKNHCLRSVKDAAIASLPYPRSRILLHRVRA
jgi:hypothetical protein